MTEQLCPGCGLRLTPGQLGQAKVDYCPTCKGAWLGTTALWELLVGGDEAAKRLKEQVDPGQAAQVFQDPSGGCPGCGAGLAKVVSPDLPKTPVLACAECRGFWLTEAALDQLAPSDSDCAASPEAQSDSPAGNHLGCPDCGELTPESGVDCWACGRLLQGVATRACPACNGVVRWIPSPGARRGCCQSCGGLWLTAGGLNDLLSLSERDGSRIIQAIERLRTDQDRSLRPVPICAECEAPMHPLELIPGGSRSVCACSQCSATFVEHLTLRHMMQEARQASPQRRRS